MTLNQRTLYILGSGWLSTNGYGTYGPRPFFSPEALPFIYPDLERIIPELPARFGRFDVYTKVSFSTAVLALKDAGLLQREGKKNIGIVVGSSSGVYDNDMAFYESTREAKGSFSSPNLFSYTLPNVALGEIAVFFGFTGPTFCVGNNPANPGSEVLSAALLLLESRQCDMILAGWVEVATKITDNRKLPKGAAFTVLSLDKTSNPKTTLAADREICFSKLVGE